MNGRLDAAVAAIRAELARQAAEGSAAYGGVAADGRDALHGRFDLVRVARAVLSTIGEPTARGARFTAADDPQIRALSPEADERQTERQAPADAFPGESGQGAAAG